jgi:hypothetical protein
MPTQKTKLKGVIKMKKIDAAKEDLKYLETESALTVEGFPPEQLELIINSCVGEEILTAVPDEVYIFAGALMNSTYGLTGDNAYPDDLMFLSITSKYVNNEVAPYHPFRAQGRYRWFDDIVINNAKTQGESAE